VFGFVICILLLWSNYLSFYGLFLLMFCSSGAYVFSDKLSKAHRPEILVIEEITMETKPRKGGILLRESFGMLSLFSFNV
jgi:hypothetical protein